MSDRPHEEVSEYERQYEDGSDPSVLDIIDIPIKKPHPKNHQQENWLLDPEYYWGRAGRYRWDDLENLAEDPETLWVNGYHTYNGFNDCIPLDAALNLTNSLVLIRTPMIQLNVFSPGEAFGNSKRRVQARFSFGGITYQLWVTDPLIERTYRALPDGLHTLGRSYLTISLGEAYNDRYYKLVAAIIQPDADAGAIT